MSKKLLLHVPIGSYKNRCARNSTMLILKLKKKRLGKLLKPFSSLCIAIYVLCKLTNISKSHFLLPLITILGVKR